MKNRKLFQYILQQDEENALRVLEPEDIHLYLTQTKEYAIHLASKRGLTQLVKQLLQYGANPYCLNKANESALSIANVEKHTEIMCEIYLSNFKVTEDIGVYLLEAIKMNDVEGLELFCQKAEKEVIQQAMVKWTDGNEKNSALHLAFSSGYMDIVALLTQYGADYQYQNSLGQTPFDLLDITNDDEIIVPSIIEPQAERALTESMIAVLNNTDYSSFFGKELREEFKQEELTQEPDHSELPAVFSHQDILQTRKMLKESVSGYDVRLFGDSKDMNRSVSFDSFLDPLVEDLRSCVNKGYGRI